MTPIPIPGDISAAASTNAHAAIVVRTALSNGPTTLEALKRAKAIQGRAMVQGRTLLLQMGQIIAATEKAERDAAKRPSLDEYNARILANREAGENIEAELASRQLEAMNP